jgi:hypothetical protein
MFCKQMRVARAEGVGLFAEPASSGGRAKRKHDSAGASSSAGADEEGGKAARTGDGGASEEARKGMELRRASTGPRKESVNARDVERYKASHRH